MKKILSIITASILGTGIIANPNLVNHNQFTNSKINIENKYQAGKRSINHQLKNFKIIKQEREYWCAPACVQSILQYMNPSGEYNNQENIAEALGTQDTGTPPQNIVPYLNSLEQQTTRRFTDSIVPQGFGWRQSDMTEFQIIVGQSLMNNIPVILNIDGNSPVSGGDTIHTFVIGEISNEDDSIPSTTNYTLYDPANGSTVEITGYDISNLFTAGNGSLISGFTGTTFDPKDDSVKIEIQGQSSVHKGAGDFIDHAKVDLTESGINDDAVLETASSITLSDSSVTTTIGSSSATSTQNISITGDFVKEHPHMSSWESIFMVEPIPAYGNSDYANIEVANDTYFGIDNNYFLDLNIETTNHTSGIIGQITTTVETGSYYIITFA